MVHFRRMDIPRSNKETWNIQRIPPSHIFPHRSVPLPSYQPFFQPPEKREPEGRLASKKKQLAVYETKRGKRGRGREGEESRSSGKVARCTILRDPTTPLSRRLRRFSHGVYMRSTLPRSVDGNGPTAGGMVPGQVGRPYIFRLKSALVENQVAKSAGSYRPG